MKVEYIDYGKMVSVFREGTMATKAEVLSGIDYRITKIEKGSGLDTNHSSAFYARFKELLLRFRKEVEDAILFEELEELWAYDIDIDATGIALILMHSNYVEYDEEDMITEYQIDQSFELIKVNAKLLTVEQYAEMYGVTTGGVRQWIRRGKLRSAIKNGGEWRIPELAEVSGRGYQYVTYRWEDELSDIPEEYTFLNECAIASIMQDRENKDLFHIRCWKVENEKTINEYNMDMDSKEKEKFELMLISNPLVKAPTEFKNIFSIEE